MTKASDLGRELFFDIVKAGIKGGELSIDTFDEAQLRSAYELLNAHELKPFAADVFHAQKGVPAYIVESAEVAADLAAKDMYFCWIFTRNLCEELISEGIEVLVLKGPTTAAMYPVPEHRSSVDIDLFIPDAKMFDRACAMLEAKGYTKEPPKAHHRVFRSQSGMEIELHSLLAEPFVKNHINKKISDIAKAEFDNRIEITVMEGVSVPGFLPQMQGLHLVLHMLQHLVGAGFGLRLLTDWICYLRSPYSKEAVDKCREYICELGLLTFVSTMTGLCVRYLGLEPQLAKAFMAQPPKEEAMERLMCEILSAKAPGKSGGRLVIAQGKGPGALAREFHHQMKCNYPRASRVVPIWPALWIISLVIFLRNNRKIRNIRTIELIKSASERSEVLKDLALFEK